MKKIIIETNDEKAQLISEIMNIENNDPLVAKMDLDDDTKKVIGFIKEKLPEKLDSIKIEDLKLMKRLTEMQVEYRKLLSKNIEIVEVVSNLLKDIINDLENEEEFINKFN